MGICCLQDKFVWEVADPQGFEPWISGSEGLRATFLVARRLVQTRLRARVRYQCPYWIKG